MWKELPLNEKQEYKRMMLAFASLTEVFAQKADDESDKVLTPVLNSKYQETIFKKTFHASEEDIGNTAYDASMRKISSNGNTTSYLIGIKTFGFDSGAQKIAQFKANHDDWADIINQIKTNVETLGATPSKAEIDKLNKELYFDLARKVSAVRNARIDSAIANLRGFTVSIKKDNVESVYHVLMPAVKDEKPVIYVGETSYDKIDEDNIKIVGCTGVRNPTNFTFKDGNHSYRFTSADSQLLMDFETRGIVQEKWDVVYVDDAYKIFSEIADRLQPTQIIQESYSWLLTNVKGEVEQFSGFNSFYGVGSKLGVDERKRRVASLKEKYKDTVKPATLNTVCSQLEKFLDSSSSNAESRKKKVKIRETILDCLKLANDKDFEEDTTKLLFRPMDEMYIPIPDSKKFHSEHPDFFAPNAGSLKDNSSSLALDKEERAFNLVFEPSGEVVRSYISQDNGKAIESTEKQTILGKWILRDIFQLQEYEPLTAKRLKELNINGIRLYRLNDSEDVHLEFIWIDKNALPDDYIK